MNLDFKILWFDDQPESMRITAEGIKTRLARLGFNLTIRSIDRIIDLKSLVPTLKREGKYDLIMLDWDMGKSASGDVIARELRTKFHYMDIVFYSAETMHELRTKIYNQGIDGVYCAQRNNLIVDTMDLIRSILKKVLDLNQMRGIMMAQVSDFDKKLTNCLMAWHELVDVDGKADLVEKIKSAIKKSHEDKLDKLTGVQPENEFNDLLEMWSFSSDLRFRVLLKILKDHNKGHTTQDILDKFKTFQSEVLKPRNDLAHVVETVVNGQTVLKCGDEIYDDDRLTQIRRGLCAHSDNLDDILASISNGIFTPS